MSFFDETDEPSPTRRARRPVGTGRRPPGDQQVIMIRRAVAGVAILIVIIVLALGVHSCQVSSHISALKSYNTSVGALVQQSDAIGKRLFKDLTGAKANGNEQTVQTDLFTLKSDAQSQLQQAQSLGPPGEVASAQQNFVLALSLRRNGISDIATRFQPALAKSTAHDALTAIAGDMQQFLASDVVYTTQTASQIAAALHAAGIPVGGNGETIQPTDFISDLGWLTPSYIGGQLGSPSSSTTSSVSGPNPCPGVCGHQLNSVSVGNVALSTGGGNTIPASPPPVFDANLTNNGNTTETNVVVTATVTYSSGATINAQAVQASTAAGQTYDVQISLPKSPPAGSAQVTVTVKGVPGETYLPNNTLKFPVTFA